MSHKHPPHSGPVASGASEDHPNSTDPANKWQKIAESSDQATESTDAEAGGADSVASSAGQPELDFPSRNQLENQLTALESQRDQAKQQALRLQAELDNLRRRHERDVSDAQKYGVNKLVLDLLPVTDSLSRALESMSPELSAAHPAVKTLAEGVQLTLDMLSNVLNKFGVALIAPAVGESFNPEKHEAMAIQESTSVAPNSVLQVLQPGYQLHDRVIRAAMVIVSK